MSEVTVRSVVYQIDGQPYEGRLAFDAEHKGARPGLLMAPNWMGVSAGAEEIAKSVAAKGYVVLIADVYGQAVRPQNADQAGAAMMPLKDDRALLRKRMQAAFEQLQKQGEAAVYTSKLAVFGFCFGGCCALEFARTGAPVKAAAWATAMPTVKVLCGVDSASVAGWWPIATKPPSTSMSDSSPVTVSLSLRPTSPSGSPPPTNSTELLTCARHCEIPS